MVNLKYRPKRLFYLGLLAITCFLIVGCTKTNKSINNTSHPQKDKYALILEKSKNIGKKQKTTIKNLKAVTYDPGPAINEYINRKDYNDMLRMSSGLVQGVVTQWITLPNKTGTMVNTAEYPPFTVLKVYVHHSLANKSKPLENKYIYVYFTGGIKGDQKLAQQLEKSKWNDNNTELTQLSFMTKEELPIPGIGTEVVINPVRNPISDVPEAQKLVPSKYIYMLTWAERSLWLKDKNGQYQMSNSNFIHKLNNSPQYKEEHETMHEQYLPGEDPLLSKDQRITKKINQLTNDVK